MDVMPDLSDGLCRGMNPDLFFPLRGGRGTTTSTYLAKATCNEGGVGGRPCPCRVECLEWALHHELFGVWGGVSERQRRRIRHDRNIIVRSSIGDPAMSQVYRRPA